MSLKMVSVISNHKKVREARGILFEFLSATLQIDQAVAHNDASQLEHLASDVTLSTLNFI